MAAILGIAYIVIVYGLSFVFCMRLAARIESRRASPLQKLSFIARCTCNACTSL